MEIKEFVELSIKAAIGAIDQSSKDLGREIYIGKNQNNSSMHFDLATTIEESDGGKMGIKVLSFFEGSAERDVRASSVSRVSFSIYIASETNQIRDERRKNLLDQQQKY